MATLKKLTRVGADVRQIARLLQAKAPEGHMLAYITPEEAKLLKSQGGSGKEHEDTGVPSFQMDDFGGYDTGGFEGLSSEPAPAMQPMPSPVEIFSPARIPNVQANAPVDLGYSAGTTPTDKPIDLGQAAPASTSQERYVPYDMSFGAQVDVLGGRLPSAMTMGAGEPQVIDTAREPSKTIGERYRDLAKSLGISEDALGKVGIGGVQALLGAYQSRKASEQGEAAKKEQQALAAPYQQKGAELQRAAQAGELTPVGQQQLQAVQAQAAQQATARGGAVGAAQMQAQIEAFRNQLLQQQYDYGLKLSGIGDQIALGAIKTGMQADQYVNQLTSSYYNNIARTLYGAPPMTQQQQTVTGAP